MTQERMQGPIYQVDTQNAASGKRLSATKRRVRWRFGFGNREALSQGMTGVDCRGEEHEVVLVWSLTSGKRLIIADGQEVYFNIGRRMDSKFETSWSMHNHVFKIVAHAAPPLVEQPGFRQFDLIIDGMSFHSFPRIFELGFRSSRNRYSLAVSDDRLGFATPRPDRVYNNYTTQKASNYSPTLVPVAATPSVRDPSLALTSPTAVYEDLLSSPNTDEKDLLSHTVPNLGYSPHSASANLVTPTHQTSQIAYAQAAAQLVDYDSTSSVQSPRGVADEFAPIPPPPRTFKDISADIMSAYGSNPSVPALTYYPHYSAQAYESSSSVAATQEDQPNPAKPTFSGAAVLKPTMQPISIVEMDERDQPPLSEMEKALKSLVNLSDITETMETPEQAKTLRNKEKNQPQKSKALPPVTPGWNLGLRPTLASIKEQGQPKAPPKREIMRTHAFDPAAAQAGMMVVYGAASFGAGMQPQYPANTFYAPHQQRMYTAY